MTHEYVIAVGGSVLGTAAAPVGEPATTSEPVATAVAWAADRILAVGADDLVRAISRGDSTFLDLAGCAVTAAPRDPDAAEAAVRSAVGAAANVLAPERRGVIDLVAVLVGSGQLRSDEILEAGAPAELAFWLPDPATGSNGSRVPRIIGLVRDGAFVDGDPHRGPFSAPGSSQGSGYVAPASTDDRHERP